MNTDQWKTGVVLIGRNEGQRLVRAIESVAGAGRPVIYVDSGSTDGSREAARARGVDVVELDMSVPFTAARARNAGLRHLRDHYPGVRYVQLIDGDCEVAPGWLELAERTLAERPEVVAVCGWRRERFPERSVYNRICDVEWRRGPVGETAAFGGDVMMRVAALEAVGGYDPTVIAAEDDELGVRLRRTGGVLWRVDELCTLHDAGMERLQQWWQRAKRCGYAYAQVSHMHGAPPERKFSREIRRTWVYGALLPCGAVVMAVPTFGLSLLAFGFYPLNAARVVLNTRREGYGWRDSLAWGASCAASVFPGVQGALRFHTDRLRRRKPEIIEYKGPAADPLR